MISSFLFPRLLFFRERFSIPYLWLPRLLFFRERSSTLPRTIFFSISPSSVSSGNDSLLFPLAPYFLFRERSFLSFSFWNDRLFRIFGCSVFSFLPVLPGTIFYSSENNLPFFRFFRERSSTLLSRPVFPFPGTIFLVLFFLERSSFPYLRLFHFSFERYLRELSCLKN